MQLLESQLNPSFVSDDNTIPKNGAIQQFQETWTKAFVEAGLVDIAPLLKSHLEDAGFEDVKVVLTKLPLGPWPKDRAKKV